MSAVALQSQDFHGSYDHTQTRPIDLVHLGRQTMGDKSLELEILRLFKTQLECHLKQLDAAPDAKTLRIRLHTIKGAAAGVGAMCVARDAGDAETQLLGEGEVEVELMDHLKSSIHTAVGYVDHLLG